MSMSTLGDPNVANPLSQIPIGDQYNTVLGPNPGESTMPALQMDPDFAAYQNFFRANYNPATGSDQLPGQWAAMTPEQKAAYSQSQAPGATEQMPSIMAPTPNIANPLSGIPIGDQYNTVLGPTPGQQLNTPSFEQLAQPMAFPMATQPPPTQQLVQQIQAPTSSLPVAQQPPATQQLINQIRKPTAATQRFAQQFRAPAPRAPAPRPAAPPQARPTFQPQIRSAARPMARSVSRVNPPLSTRPTGRR